MILEGKLGGDGYIFLFFLLCLWGIWEMREKRKKRGKEEGVEGNESDLIGVALSGPVSKVQHICVIAKGRRF